MKKKIYIFLLTISLLSGYVMAQKNADGPPPFSYEVAEGTTLYQYGKPQHMHIIRMEGIFMGRRVPDENALMVAFDAQLDLSIANDKRILSFRQSQSDMQIDFFYSDSTFTVRRYVTFLDNRNADYYDYHLFDPLFAKPASGNTASNRIKVYFTSSFMYIVVKMDGSEKSFMSPLYFGLDHQFFYPDPQSIMYTYLSTTTNDRVGSYILIGAEEQDIEMSNIKISSIVYHKDNIKNPDGTVTETNDWRRTIQKEFSLPHEPDKP
jgi:hypothetical protein